MRDVIHSEEIIKSIPNLEPALRNEVGAGARTFLGWLMPWPDMDAKFVLMLAEMWTWLLITVQTHTNNGGPLLTVGGG